MRPVESKRGDADEVKSTGDESAIVIQTWMKGIISREKTKQSTLAALGKGREISIKQRSKQNLAKIRTRLGKLSEPEKSLLDTLLKKSYIMHHTTASSVLDHIRSKPNPSLLDPTEVMRQGLATSKLATPEFCGIDNNVFFGMAGSSKHSLPYFVRNRTNLQGEVEDYSTVRIDLNKYMANNPNSGIWAGGHYAQYEDALVAAPSEPVKIGSTEYFWEYKLENAYKKNDRTYVKILHFKQADGVDKQIRIEIGDEVATNKDLIPFIAYSFIERLRNIGGEIQRHLLDNPGDQELIDSLIEQLFRVDNFEVHIPTKVELNDDVVSIMTPRDRKRITQQVSQAAANGDIEALAALNKQGAPLDGYMYEDSYTYDGSAAITLPLIAAIKNNQVEAVRWLIDHGANRSSFINKCNSISNAVESKDMDSNLTTLLIVCNAFESQNETLLTLLCEKGLNVAACDSLTISDKRSQSMSQQDMILSLITGEDEEACYLKNINALFSVLIEATKKTGNFDILQSQFTKFGFIKRPHFISNTLYQTIAMVGNKAIYEFFQQKFACEVDQNELFIIALKNNNTEMAQVLIDGIDIESHSNQIQQAVLAILHKGDVKLAQRLIALTRFTLRPLNDHSLYNVFARTDALSDKTLIEITEYLLENNYLAEITQSIVLCGIYSKKTSFVAWLIQKAGVSPDRMPCEEFSTPAWQAAVETESVELLSMLEAIPSKAYEIAIREKKESVFRWLIDNNIEPPSNLFTLLLRSGTIDMFDYLEEHSPQHILEMPPHPKSLQAPFDQLLQEFSDYLPRADRALHSQINALRPDLPEKTKQLIVEELIGKDVHLEKFKQHYAQLKKRYPAYKLYSTAICMANTDALTWLKKNTRLYLLHSLMRWPVCFMREQLMAIALLRQLNG